MLEKGRNLRKLNEPIQCRVKIYRVWRDSKGYIERTNSNLKKRAEEGTLPPDIHPEIIHPYSQRWQDYCAIIPMGGISQKGYVKEVLIEMNCMDPIEVDNKTFHILNPIAHDTEQWIQGFILKGDTTIKLLPSPKIVVKYFQESHNE